MEDGAHNHDPASPPDTAFTAKAVRGQEGNYGADKASYVVNAGNDTFEVSIWIVEFFPERWETDDSTEDSLVVAEKLGSKSGQNLEIFWRSAQGKGRRNYITCTQNDTNGIDTKQV